MSEEKIVGVHLDLKGMMFRPEYAPRLLEDLARQGVNTVLVEYEDVFPFENIEVAWDKSVCFDAETLENFLTAAAQNDLEVIPLQQCLGHLEYVFRWTRYRDYALDPAYPGTLDLSQPDGKALVRDMLGQICGAHPDSRFVHLGLDEAQLVGPGARETDVDVFGTYLDYLGELTEFLQDRGKTPLVWSDMLQDHFDPDALDRLSEFKDRVILMPWDYSASGPTSPTGRICGQRVSRQWLDDPGHPRAPDLTPTTGFIEDLPAPVKRLVEPYIEGREWRSLFPVDLWTDLGFRVLGAGALRVSGDYEVAPQYNRRHANLRAWARAIERTDQMGVVATSWARGTTFCPPNFCRDLTWPSVRVFSGAMGHRPEPFWPGPPPQRVRRVVGLLGACREGSSVEGQLIEDLESMRGDLQGHVYEWDSMTLMTRVLRLQKRAEHAVSEVEYFDANVRPPEGEWQRRLADQEQISTRLRSLRKDVYEHFSRRYHGEAFEEWVREMFDIWESRLQRVGEVCRRKKTIATERYGANGHYPNEADGQRIAGHRP